MKKLTPKQASFKTYCQRIGYTGKPIFNRLQAIKQKCLDCHCWQPKEAQACDLSDCALFPFNKCINSYYSLLTYILYHINYQKSISFLKIFAD